MHNNDVCIYSGLVTKKCGKYWHFVHGFQMQYNLFFSKKWTFLSYSQDRTFICFLFFPTYFLYWFSSMFLTQMRNCWKSERVNMDYFHAGVHLMYTLDLEMLTGLISFSLTLWIRFICIQLYINEFLHTISRKAMWLSWPSDIISKTLGSWVWLHYNSSQ